MIGFRVDDSIIISKIKEDLSVREIVNALSELSLAEKSTPLMFSKISVGSKEKQVAEFTDLTFKSLKQGNSLKANSYNLH